MKQQQERAGAKIFYVSLVKPEITLLGGHLPSARY